MADLTAPAEHDVEIGGLRISSMEQGSGPVLLVLHRSTGNTGWNHFYECLAERFTVIVPDLPGYGGSTMPEWAREPRDLAVLMLQYVRKLGLQDAVLVGLGLGGFIAAEMATMRPDAFSRLVLVGAAGLKPEDGEILDQMVIDHAEYVKAGFRDEETAAKHLGDEVDKELVTLWQFNRVMTARIAWRPYMFSLRLAPLLAEVDTPALIVWGGADRVVPPSTGRQYERSLPNARLEVIDEAGHLVEIEEPERVASLIRAHVDNAASVRA